MDNPGQTFPLNSKVLAKVNKLTIAKLFDDYAYFVARESAYNILLYLSDAVLEMVKSGNVIKIFYLKVIHVTCVVHGFHCIAEKIYGHYS